MVEVFQFFVVLKECSGRGRLVCPLDAIDLVNLT